MFMVYWTIRIEDKNTPHQMLFDTAEMVQAMQHMEGLRKRRREGEDICFISMSSENPDQVGQMGVDVTGPDYNWKKRRR